MDFRIKNPETQNDFYGNGISKTLKNGSSFNVGVIGDSGVGKTSLVQKWAAQTGKGLHENFLSFHIYSHTYYLNEKPYLLCIMDLEPTLDHVHALQAYHFFDMVLVCYSVDNRKSFENAVNIWDNEINEHCGGLHKILVALKTDLRTDVDAIQRLAAEGTTPVTQEEGEGASKTYDFIQYHECSSYTGDGHNLLLDSIVVLEDIEIE